MEEFAQRPLFHSSMLNIFSDPPKHIQIQLSRWVRAGKLIQIRRGWYLIARPYRLKEISLPVIANRIVHPSYLSLDWAMQYYDLIPEHIPNPTSVTSGRGMTITVQDNFFIYRHVQSTFFYGYEQREYSGYTVILALPEKALLDKIYLFSQKNPFSLAWLAELRLQNLDQLNLRRFKELSTRINRRGWTKIMESSIAYLEEQMT